MEEEKEIWKPVVGYEGYYEVSSFGNIRSLDRSVIYSNGSAHTYKSKRLKVQKYKNGYCYVELNLNGVGKKHQVHRLVCNAFLPNPNNLPEVNHKDENPSNNHLSNLEFCSRTYNNNYGHRNEKVSNSFKTNGYGRAVIQFSIDGDFIKEFPLLSSVKEDGFNLKCVHQCCKHKMVSHKNFIFLYKEDADMIQKCVEQYKKKSIAINRKPIIAYKKDGTYVGKYESIHDASIELSVFETHISKCCRGKLKSSKGYTFKYAE